MSEDRTQNLPNDELRQILAQLTSINARLDSMDTRFDRIDARLDGMDARLERLEAREYDTKPIWENALREITDARAEMREGFERVNGEMGRLRGEVETGLRKMAKQIDILNHNLLGVEAEMRLLDDRMSKLEPQPAP
jgi:chromosome segregation ATPase